MAIAKLTGALRIVGHNAITACPDAALFRHVALSLREASP